jgi:hypothetical protein
MTLPAAAFCLIDSPTLPIKDQQAKECSKGICRANRAVNRGVSENFSLRHFSGKHFESKLNFLFLSLNLSVPEL